VASGVQYQGSETAPIGYWGCLAVERKIQRRWIHGHVFIHAGRVPARNKTVTSMGRTLPPTHLILILTLALAERCRFYKHVTIAVGGNGGMASLQF
jgi:hypothetical protein